MWYFEAIVPVHFGILAVLAALAVLAVLVAPAGFVVVVVVVEFAGIADIVVDVRGLVVAVDAVAAQLVDAADQLFEEPVAY